MAVTLNNTISSDLQSSLLSLSSLAHEDKRSTSAKSSEFEEIGNTILKKIYAEDANLPPSARLYLAQIASSIVNNKWSDIPPPVEMNLDFQSLKAITTALNLAIGSTTIDLFELFRFIMEQKGNEAYNLAKIGIMDTKLALDLDKQRFEEQASANHKEMVAGVVAGALQCVQGCVQAWSSAKSIHKNTQLGLKTEKAINDSKTTADAKIDFDSAMETKQGLASKYRALENEISVLNAKNPNDPSIDKLKETQGKVGVKLQQANEKANESAKNYNELNSKLEADSKKIDQLTNLERFKDQLRSNIIQAVKGAADVGVAYLRYEASEDKRKADMLEAAKNTTDRSANAMSESGRKAADDVKKILQYFDSILQMMDASIKKQFS